MTPSTYQQTGFTDTPRTTSVAPLVLRPLDADDVERCAAWLAEPRNHQWLDSGGVQALSAVSLRIMTQRDVHLIRTFSPAPDHPPIGIVALSRINRLFRSASLWYVLGDKRFARQGWVTTAVGRLLAIGFRDVGLESVHAWVVEGHAASVRVLLRNRFSLMGRQRRCHLIDGVLRDRLLFDVLRSEFEGDWHA